MAGEHEANIRIRVVVVTALRLYREGLAQLLEQDPRLTVVGTAATLEEAVTVIRDTRPDVAILDLHGRHGRSAVRVLAETEIAPRVVALAVPETESGIVGWAEAGIAGFVTRDQSLCDLVATVVAAANGELRCSPRIAAALLRRVHETSGREDPEPVAKLTPRETQVAQLIDEGLSNKEIAWQLRIEHATVKNHVHNILEKLRAGTRGEATARLRRRGALPVRMSQSD